MPHESWFQKTMGKRRVEFRRLDGSVDCMSLEGEFRGIITGNIGSVVNL